MSEIRARLAAVFKAQRIGENLLDTLTPAVEALVAAAVAAEDKRGYDAFARLTADWREILAAKDTEIQRLERQIAAVLSWCDSIRMDPKCCGECAVWVNATKEVRALPTEDA